MVDRPGIIEILSTFETVPPRFIVDSTILNETWDWACKIGVDEPVPTFSMDDVPTLCFMAVVNSDPDSVVYQLASGITLMA